MDNEKQLNLTNLPNSLVARMLSFVPNASCLSLLVAMEQSPLSFQSAAVKAIAAASGKNWEIFDFKDVQDVMGRSLTDDDIRRVLIGIDGVNNIKSLKLARCFDITGAGLSPLRGSTVLEGVDMNIRTVGQGKNRGNILSEEEVVPILSSILDREDNSLSWVVLPYEWRWDWKDMLASFLRRFNDSLLSRRIDQLDRDDVWLCESCEGRFFEGCIHVLQCGRCERETCEGCGDYCEKCESIFCLSCDIIRVCDYCEKKHCFECSVKCDDCNKVNCEACSDEHEEGIKECSMCNDWGFGLSRCFDCRVSRRVDSCTGCAAMVAPLLARKLNKEKRKNRRLRRRIEQMEG